MQADVPVLKKQIISTILCSILVFTAINVGFLVHSEIANLNQIDETPQVDKSSIWNIYNFHEFDHYDGIFTKEEYDDISKFPVSR